jgi:hydroxyethylthiazole kinase-like uncharacterized protein yjeF
LTELENAMTELLTAAQMRAIEGAAIDSGEVTGLELMERAGRGVVEAIFEEWPELAKTAHRAVVLCGPGNNGGDGFVVARLLKDWGWEVEVFLYGDAEKLPPDARVNYERWLERGEVEKLDSSCTFDVDTDAQVLFVDALFGTGLGRPLSSDLSTLASYLALVCGVSNNLKCVAIDISSGIDSDSGKELSNFPFSAGLTVSFHAAKVGHFLNEAPRTCGSTVVKSIGLTGDYDPNTVRLVEKAQFEFWPFNKASAHKYSHGHALILSGPAGFTGASRLAARGALRIGAGLVTIACEHEALAEHAAQLTSIMLTRVADAHALENRLSDARINALCLGPGMGVERARELVPVALGATHPGQRAGTSDGKVPGQARDGVRSVVLDADALTAFADAPEDLFAILHENCVLTPHGGEFARLFPDIAEKLNATPTKGPAFSKVDATREAAARAGCVVLLKGPDTVIAAPDGRCSINSAHYDRAAPWLATAGSGDVLAGFITGLMARGFAPMQAAEAGAWLHVECARSFGPGLIAEDLPEQLPAVFRAFGL